MAHLRVAAFQRHQRRALHDRNVVAREVVLAQQFPHFQFHQIQQFRIVDHVHLVQEHHDRRNAHLTRQQDVFPRLRHRAVRRRNHQDRAVHLRRARDHVLDVVRVTRAIHVRVVTVFRLVLHVRRRNRDPARLFFRRLVDLVVRRERRPARLRKHLRDRRRQRRLPMVNVADRTHVAVRFRAFEFFLRHGLVFLCLD